LIYYFSLIGSPVYSIPNSQREKKNKRMARKMDIQAAIGEGGVVGAN
jgi:hypothetical protein